MTPTLEYAAIRGEVPPPRHLHDRGWATLVLASLCLAGIVAAFVFSWGEPFVFEMVPRLVGDAIKYAPVAYLGACLIRRQPNALPALTAWSAGLLAYEFYSVGGAILVHLALALTGSGSAPYTHLLVQACLPAVFLLISWGGWRYQICQRTFPILLTVAIALAFSVGNLVAIMYCLFYFVTGSLSASLVVRLLVQLSWLAAAVLAARLLWNRSRHGANLLFIYAVILFGFLPGYAIWKWLQEGSDGAWQGTLYGLVSAFNLALLITSTIALIYLRRLLASTSDPLAGP